MEFMDPPQSCIIIASPRRCFIRNHVSLQQDPSQKMNECPEIPQPQSNFARIGRRRRHRRPSRRPRMAGRGPGANRDAGRGAGARGLPVLPHEQQQAAAAAALPRDQPIGAPRPRARQGVVQVPYCDIPKNENREVPTNDKVVIKSGKLYKSEYTTTKILNKELEGLHKEMKALHKLICGGPNSDEVLAQMLAVYNSKSDRVRSIVDQIKNEKDGGMPLPMPKVIEKKPKPYKV